MAKIRKDDDELATKGFVREEMNIQNQINNERFDRIEKRMDTMEEKAEGRFSKLMEILTDIAGQFKKFDEERVVLSGRQREHGDRIEKLEEEVFKTS